MVVTIGKKSLKSPVRGDIMVVTIGKKTLKAPLGATLCSFFLILACPG